MSKNEKVANIIAFLLVLFGEDESIVNKMSHLSPEYIIEKYERYMESNKIKYTWGMHPSLKNELFHRYLDKWKIELNEG